MFDVAETVGRSRCAEGERLYWFIGVVPSNTLFGFFDDAVEALISTAKFRGLNTKAIRALVKRKGKDTHKVLGLQLRICAEPNGEVSAQVIVYWARRAARGKAYPVAWA